ncbi:GGDEF domain-containing protein, partial [Aeromonas dhakensis]
MLSQGLDHWVRHSERLVYLSSSERISLIESLLAQQSLSDLLATFASEAAKIVRIRSLFIDCGQPRHI